MIIVPSCVVKVYNFCTISITKCHYKNNTCFQASKHSPFCYWLVIHAPFCNWLVKLKVSLQTHATGWADVVAGLIMMVTQTVQCFDSTTGFTLFDLHMLSLHTKWIRRKYGMLTKWHTSHLINLCAEDEGLNGLCHFSDPILPSFFSGLSIHSSCKR